MQNYGTLQSVDEDIAIIPAQGRPSAEVQADIEAAKAKLAATEVQEIDAPQDVPEMMPTQMSKMMQ
jgi:hypothetical protein